MKIRIKIATYLALGFLAAMTPLTLPSQEPRDTSRATAAARSGDEDTVTCYHRLVCEIEDAAGTIVETEFRFCATEETETQAYAAALAAAQEARDDCIAENGTVKEFGPDGCDPVETLKAAVATGLSQNVLVQYSCIARNGKRLRQVHYGERQFLQLALIPTAWNALLHQAAKHGGIAPGTQRLAICDEFEYRAYIRLTSIENTAKVHRDFMVEGRGATKNEAVLAVTDAVNRVKTEASGSEDFPASLPTPQIRKLRLFAAGKGRTTKLCVVKCETALKWTVFVTAYDTSKTSACAVAEERAQEVSNQLYSAATSCEEIDPGMLP